jgi:hypothetical protein
MGVGGSSYSGAGHRIVRRDSPLSRLPANLPSSGSSESRTNASGYKGGGLEAWPSGGPANQRRFGLSLSAA